MTANRRLGRTSTTKAAPKKKQPNPIDIHVGARVRMARLMIGMSQERLGDGLGLTFQQVQKYEKGANRIGSSRLVQIAGVVGQPVTFFFGGNEGGQLTTNDLLASGEGLRLAKAFNAIKNTAVKWSIVALVEILGKE